MVSKKKKQVQKAPTDLDLTAEERRPETFESGITEVRAYLEKLQKRTGRYSHYETTKALTYADRLRELKEQGVPLRRVNERMMKSYFCELSEGSYSVYPLSLSIVAYHGGIEALATCFAHEKEFVEDTHSWITNDGEIELSSTLKDDNGVFLSEEREELCREFGFTEKDFDEMDDDEENTMERVILVPAINTTVREALYYWLPSKEYLRKYRMLKE